MSLETAPSNTDGPALDFIPEAIVNSRSIIMKCKGLHDYYSLKNLCNTSSIS